MLERSLLFIVGGSKSLMLLLLFYSYSVGGATFVIQIELMNRMQSYLTAFCF